VSTPDAQLLSAASPPRVQRLVDRLPPVHLEAEVPPAAGAWTLRVDGMVERPLELSLEALHRLSVEHRAMDFHCVWGWSRAACRWTGVACAELLDAAGVDPAATVATVAAADEPYAACLHLEDARAGLLAWALDGVPLAAENGWPLRFVQPPWLWGYKGVKWVGRITVGDRFEPGFWEAKTGDAEGRVPAEVLATFDHGEAG
jgi:DMSO/TMAO reductase YedYZ molybdopterin-dependent catalytic subunit